MPLSCKIQEHIPFFQESLEHADGSSSTSVASEDLFDSVLSGAGSAAAFLLDDDREKMPAKSLEANHIGA
jgi:hypothetical protein